LHNVWHLGGHGPLGPLNPPLAGASQAGFSRLDTVHERVRDRETDRGQTDRQTDRRTDTGRQQRPRLRIASRGKNPSSLGKPR